MALTYTSSGDFVPRPFRLIEPTCTLMDYCALFCVQYHRYFFYNQPIQNNNV